MGLPYGVRVPDEVRLLDKFFGKARPAIFVAGVLVSAICFYLAFRKLDWAYVGHKILRMDWKAIAFGLVLVNLHNLLLAKRWQLLLKPLGRITYGQAFWSLRVSFFFNASLPARLGEPFRVFYVHKRTPISAAHAVGATAADHCLDFITMGLLFLVSVFVLEMRGTLPPIDTLVFSLVVVILGLFALAKLPKQSRFRWLNWLFQLRVKIFEGAMPLLKWRVLLPTIPISLLGWLIEAMIIVSFSYGVGAPISFFKAVMVNAAITLAISIPSTPGHLGTFEFGAITMLSFFGLTRSQAATIAICYHMIQLIPTLLIGAYGYHFHFIEPVKKKKKSSPALADPEIQPAPRELSSLPIRGKVLEMEDRKTRMKAMAGNKSSRLESSAEASKSIKY